MLESPDNYVSLGFAKWSPFSKEYQGVDMELKVEFASILWECHRPTIAALISFGLDVTLAMEVVAVEEAAKVKCICRTWQHSIPCHNVASSIDSSM